LKPLKLVSGAAITTSISDLRNNVATRFSDQSASIKSLSDRLEEQRTATDDRTRKYIPLIEKMQSDVSGQDYINKTQADQIKAQQDQITAMLRQLDAIRDSLIKTREEFLIDGKKRSAIEPVEKFASNPPSR
jgi:uncharacterized coiled-coil DUF342 family protein